MGQLEKYGLYVLCLVIFLILGVTIWGEPAAALKKTHSDNVAIRANALGIEPNVPTATPATAPGPANQGNFNRVLTNGAGGDSGLIDSWLKPGARPPKPGSSGTRSGGTGSGGPGSGGPGSSGTGGSGPGGNNPVGNGPSSNAPSNTTGKPSAGPVKPKAAPTPQPGATTRKYIVKSGDTLGEIAQRQLGSTRFVKSIKALNPKLDARRLQVGKSILLPASAGGKTSAPARNGSYRTYTISSGDSFERIARIELGSAKRVNELIQLNANVDPRRLIPGKKIKLPRK